LRRPGEKPPDLTGCAQGALGAARSRRDFPERYLKHLRRVPWLPDEDGRTAGSASVSKTL
jgi:hypothetical protein